MEAQNQKSLERIVSQKALQLGSSFPCQICVVGFLCGVCIASLFLGAFTSLGSPLGFGWSSFSPNSQPASLCNSTSENISKFLLSSSLPWKYHLLIMLCLIVCYEEISESEWIEVEYQALLRTW